MRKNPQIYVSGDQHFAHKNCASKNTSNWSSGYRNFKSLEEHDETILNNILALPEGSVLINLGDFVPFKGIRDVASFLTKIQKHVDLFFIKGNHDDFIKPNKIDYYGDFKIIDFENNQIQNDLFTLVWYNQYAIEYGGKSILMSHHPMQDFRGFDIHLHGHKHDEYGSKQIKNRFDVGVDVAYRLTGEYRPFHIDEVFDFMGM